MHQMLKRKGKEMLRLMGILFALFILSCVVVIIFSYIIPFLPAHWQETITHAGKWIENHKTTVNTTFTTILSIILFTIIGADIFHIVLGIVFALFKMEKMSKAFYASKWFHLTIAFIAGGIAVYFVLTNYYVQSFVYWLSSFFVIP